MSPGRDLREHRQLADPLQVRRRPLERRMAVARKSLTPARAQQPVSPSRVGRVGSRLGAPRRRGWRSRLGQPPPGSSNSYCTPVSVLDISHSRPPRRLVVRLAGGADDLGIAAPLAAAVRSDERAARESGIVRVQRRQRAHLARSGRTARCRSPATTARRSGPSRRPGGSWPRRPGARPGSEARRRLPPPGAGARSRTSGWRASTGRRRASCCTALALQIVEVDRARRCVALETSPPAAPARPSRRRAAARSARSDRDGSVANWLSNPSSVRRRGGAITPALLISR